MTKPQPYAIELTRPLARTNTVNPAGKSSTCSIFPGFGRNPRNPGFKAFSIASRCLSASARSRAASRLGEGGSSMTLDESPRMVGPVITCGEFADAVLESIQEDNPDKTFIVERNAAYIRIKVEDECILRMTTLEQALGRPVRRGDLEMNMPSFAGFIQTMPDYVRFFSKK